MPKVLIELDYDVVQKAIEAKVPDAVEDILRRYDLQRIVESAIVSDKKPPADDRHRYSVFSLMGAEPPSPRERFEAALNSAISKALEEQATQYLKDHCELFRVAVERALPAALAKLTLRLKTDDDDD